MKRIDVLVCLCCVGLFFTGCSNSIISETEISVTEEDPENENPRIQLYVSPSEDVRIYSEETIDEDYYDNAIWRCCVIWFDEDGIFRDSITINDYTQIQNNGGSLALLPQLPSRFKIDNGDKVYVICNYDPSLPQGVELRDTTDINKVFKGRYNYGTGGSAIPMSGSVTWSTTSSPVVTLTRAYAKVVIQLGENYTRGANMNDSLFIDYPPFRYWRVVDESVFGAVIVNPGGISDIIPPPSTLSANVSGVTPFYATAFYTRFKQYLPPQMYDQTTTIPTVSLHISEYPNSRMDCEGNLIDVKEFNEKRTFLLLMDSFSGKTPNPKYMGVWRLDFYDAVKKEYLDIKRNHTYTFTVNEIRSAPYLESGEINYNKFRYDLWGTGGRYVGTDLRVWHNPGSNIEYTIDVKDDWASGTYSNGQFALSVSTDTITDWTIPFKIKIHVPDGGDINPSTIGGHYIYIFDGKKTSIVSPSIPFAFMITNLPVVDATPTPGTSTRWGYEIPVNGTTTTIRFKYDNTHPEAVNLDGAYLYIEVGNIRKIIPIKIQL
jgi:hypothetical protein